MRMVGRGCVGCRFCGCVRACVGCLLPGKSYWDQGEKCFVSELLFGLFFLFISREKFQSLLFLLPCARRNIYNRPTKSSRGVFSGAGVVLITSSSMCPVYIS